MLAAMKVVVALGFAAVTVASMPTAGACIPPTNFEHQLDPAHGNDTVAPGAPTVTLGEIRRPTSESNDCSGSYVELIVHATDDRAPADRLGYDVTILDATTPLVDDMRVLGGEGQSLYLQFTGRHPALVFPLNVEVRAVDLNGNTSTATAFSAEIELPPDDGGCSATGTSPGWLALAALALLRRRERPACRRR